MINYTDKFANSKKRLPAAQGVPRPTRRRPVAPGADRCPSSGPRESTSGKAENMLKRRHTHTHIHFQVQGLEKGVSENEAPGPVGAYTTSYNNTQRHKNIDADSHSPNLIHRTEIRMSHAGCRGYIGRQEHPETQSNTRTYGTKKSSYVHAYLGRDGKWRKRVQT